MVKLDVILSFIDIYPAFRATITRFSNETQHGGEEAIHLSVDGVEGSSTEVFFLHQIEYNRFGRDNWKFAASWKFHSTIFQRK